MRERRHPTHPGQLASLRYCLVEFTPASVTGNRIGSAFVPHAKPSKAVGAHEPFAVFAERTHRQRFTRACLFFVRRQPTTCRTVHMDGPGGKSSSGM